MQTEAQFQNPEYSRLITVAGPVDSGTNSLSYFNQLNFEAASRRSIRLSRVHKAFLRIRRPM